MTTLIKGGRVITPGHDGICDVRIEGQRVTSMGIDLPINDVATDELEVIDATGKYVFPGFIDPHVHIYLPFMGTYAKDDYESASRAALVGGTTTLIEMCCPGRDDDPWEAYQLWKSKAVGKSICDFSFHMGITRFDDQTESVIERIVDDGVTSLKVFLAYKGAFAVTDAELYQVCQVARRMGLVITAHCENAELIAAKQAELIAAGKIGPGFHEPSRPVGVEASGVNHFCSFLEQTGARGYIVHTSCRDAVDAAMSFQRRGVDVQLETVIPYLVLDSTAAEQAEFEGAKYVMSPPIRSKEHQEYLWDALAAGIISTVATDHAPFDFAGQKEMGRPPESDFTKIPNGIPSVEHRVTLLFTHGVATGRITLDQFVAMASTNAAKQFGMFPKKGTIAAGSDADVVIWDPHFQETISSATHHMQTDYSGFEGMATMGRAETVLVRGEVVVRDGRCVGKPGFGQPIERQCG